MTDNSLHTTSSTALIVGATSSLSYALCKQLAHEGYDLLLWGRNKQELDLVKSDLTIRYNIAVTTIIQDINTSLDIASFIDTLPICTKAFIVVGDMGSDDFDDSDNINTITDINYTLPASIITHLALTMEANDGGNIAVISSVAGDRGRKSNYIYGSAKSALTTFSSGLRHRYFGTNVHIMTVKPGFIDTPMTFSIDSPLIASREHVARHIITSLERKKDSIYTPFFWRYIMLIIRLLPETLFKKTDL